MTEMATSPLRRRMIEDMTVRNFVEKTQNDYIRHVKNLAAFLGRSPDTATAEDLRLYQLHLTEGGIRPPTINAAVSALRFFFSVTLDRPDVTRLLTFVAEPRKIPIVLSLEEVVRFLEAAPGPKYKAALSAAYGAGLRVWRASGHNLRAAEPGPEAHQRKLQKPDPGSTPRMLPKDHPGRGDCEADVYTESADQRSPRLAGKSDRPRHRRDHDGRIFAQKVPAANRRPGQDVPRHGRPTPGP